MNVKPRIALEEMVAGVKEYALANYDKGGMDYVVECYEDEEIADIVKNCRSVAGAIKAIRKAIKPLADYRDDIRAEAF